MLIKFSVLWVEDEDKWYEASYKVLDRYLQQLGFHLVVKRIANPEETNWEEHFETTSQYDLMLVDWRIKQVDRVDKAVGADVIDRIRTDVPYSDIIFYSGDSGVDAEGAKLQGVYTSRRQNVCEDAKELIDHLLHKSLHPRIMRGIIVSSLSEIDEMCFKIIQFKYESMDAEEKVTFAADFRKTILEQSEDQLKVRKKVTEKCDSDFMADLHSTLVLDSSRRASKVVKLFRKSNDPLDKHTYQRLTDLTETIQKRNWLAHWKHLDETDSKIVLAEVGKDNYVFDQDEATRMRKKINEAGTVLSEYLAAVER